MGPMHTPILMAERRALELKEFKSAFESFDLYRIIQGPALSVSV
jgi:hypothetical protein